MHSYLCLVAARERETKSEKEREKYEVVSDPVTHDKLVGLGVD